jgi:hypothetical protein
MNAAVKEGLPVGQVDRDAVRVAQSIVLGAADVALQREPQGGGAGLVPQVEWLESGTGAAAGSRSRLDVALPGIG